MSAEVEFRALLASHAPLVALVGTRIAENAVGEGDRPPLVVFTADHEPELGIDGGVLCDEVTFAVQCWGKTAAEAAQVAAAVTAAVAAAPPARYAEVIAKRGTFDAELQLDGVELTVEWTA
jgi:hypothetical protein